MHKVYKEVSKISSFPQKDDLNVGGERGGNLSYYLFKFHELSNSKYGWI